MRPILLFDLGETLVRYYNRDEFPALLWDGIQSVSAELERSGHRIPSDSTIKQRVEQENYEARNGRVRPLYTEGWHGFLTSRIVFQKPSGFHFAVLSSILSFQLPSFTMTLFPLLIPSRPTVSEWGYFQIARGELPVSLGSMNSAGTAF